MNQFGTIGHQNAGSELINFNDPGATTNSKWANWVEILHRFVSRLSTRFKLIIFFQNVS